MTQWFNPIVLKIDGGIGREICAIPAIEALAKTTKRQIVVIAGFPQVFENNPYIERVYPFSNAYLWEDVISNGEFIYPEPYHDVNYYSQKHHLIQSFNWILNKTEDKLKPNIYLTSEEESYGRSEISNYKKNYKAVVMFQPFGSGFQEKQLDTSKLATPEHPMYASLVALNGNLCSYEDKTNRSLTMDDARQLAKSAKETLFLNVSAVQIKSESNVINIAQNLRTIFSLTKYCDSIISVDSFLQHVGYAFEKTGTVFLGATYRQNVSYDHFKIVQKKGYPKAYCAIRFDGFKDTYNRSAMEGILNEL